MLALSQTRTHNAANELQTIVNGGTTSFAYDQAGNTLSLPITPSGGTLSLSGTCIYDAWNRLVQVSSGTTTLASYSYDGLGRRTQKLNLTSSATTDYYLAGQQVVETDYTSGGITALQYQYVWSARYIDAPILRDDSTNGATYPRLYYLNDANFNVTSLTGTNGSVVERCVYDAYGAPMFYCAHGLPRLLRQVRRLATRCSTPDENSTPKRVFTTTAPGTSAQVWEGS